MDILYALEKIRTPFWNGVMSAVTQLGGEVIFIVAAVVVFWCVSKWEGYYLMTIAFCGTVLNQFLKLICRVPRPWVRDPNFTIVESARAEATGQLGKIPVYRQAQHFLDLTSVKVSFVVALKQILIAFMLLEVRNCLRYTLQFHDFPKILVV